MELEERYENVAAGCVDPVKVKRKGGATMPGRPDWDEWAFGIVDAISKRGDCTRRQVGALILGPDHRIFGSGYNGSFPGGPSCLEGECPRGRHYEIVKRDLDGGPGSVVIYTCKYHRDRPHMRCLSCTPVKVCACGNGWPCPDAVAPGSAYDTGPGACIASHAEANAVADALRRAGGDLDGCVMYVSCEPCEGCVRHVRNTTRVQLICWPEGAVALP